MRNDAENYYLNNIIYRRRFKDCFNIWRGLSLRLRNQKKKIMDYLENKNKNLKITCFKLWRFFIYYRKTRNSRFEKITNIIRLNHLNMMVYRIFYSWKLKMIELRSLKNSIFSFWNSGMGLEMDESGLGVEDDERGGRRGRGVGGRGRGRGRGGMGGEMVRGEMVRGEMVREEIEEGRGEIKERREMNELISPSTFNSPSQYSLEFSVDSLSLKLKEEEDGGGEEDLNNGEKRRKGRVENKDVERKDYGFMSIFSSSGNSSLELVSQRLESKRQDDLRGVVKEREIQGQPKNNYGNSSPSSTREYVNRLLSSSSSSLSVLSNISEKVSIKESPYTNSNTRRSPNSYSKARRSFSPFLQYSVSSSSSSSLQSLSYSDGDLEIDELHSATKLKINRTRKNQNSLDWNSPSLSPQPLPSSLSPPPVTSSSLHPSLSSSPPPISRQSLSLPRQQSNPSSPSLPPPSLPPPPPPQYSSYKSSNSSNNDSMIRNRSNLSSRLPLPFPIPIQQQPQLQMVNQDMKQLYDSNFTSSSSSSLSYFSSAFSPFSYSKKITEDPNSLLVKLDTDTNQTIKDLPQDPYHISSSSPIFKTIKTDLNNIPNQNLKDGQQIESNLNIKPTHSQNNNIFTSSISSSSSSSFSSQSP
ncbi:hypothetical protein ChUKH1_08840 [Cryptosporidium hominis]|nr:hypothetical protein ChTU502y2012_387g0175 [Cryptosporidium hominis]PPA63634.1 hypothetical protein ChUKH1_08840 [Cryptosporidium hominis]